MALPSDYCLHQQIFKGDLAEVSKLIRVSDINAKDIHGNTPLHLAVMLGRQECVHLLLAHGAKVRAKNTQGWSPLAEAISRGNRQILTVLLKKLKQQSREATEQRRPGLVQALEALGPFYLELKWEFHSWVPLVSRILPSDVCKIYKKGSQIRMDTTLLDFSEMKWERGDVTFLFNGHMKPSRSLIVLDNKQKVYQYVRYEETDEEIEEEVDVLMSSDIVTAQMPTLNVTFSRAQTGWLFRGDRHEKIGSYSADVYHIHNLVFHSKKRREHLSSEDVKKNKQLMDNLTKGQLSDVCNVARRQSLAPPQPADVSWQDYLRAAVGQPPNLSRPTLCKESSKTFKAQVAMSDAFPMTMTELLDVLEVIAPFKQFGKLRDFMQTKLPPGFPIKLDIPVFPTVTARITFQDFTRDADIPDSMFNVPADYKEDSLRFPDL